MLAFGCDRSDRRRVGTVPPHVFFGLWRDLPVILGVQILHGALGVETSELKLMQRRCALISVPQEQARLGNLRFEAGASMCSKSTCTPRSLETLRMGRWKVVERSTANIELIMHVSMLVTGAVHEHKSLVQSCGGLQSRALATQRCGKARA